MNGCSRRDFLKTTSRTALGALAAGPLAAAGLSCGRASESLKPNIIFILADDLGYGDLGCYGQELIDTSNIDKLAAAGMRFTQCYAASTVCAPSRSGLMEGKHTGHCRVRGNFPRAPLRPDDITVAEVLKKAGNTTDIAG